MKLNLCVLMMVGLLFSSSNAQNTEVSRTKKFDIFTNVQTFDSSSFVTGNEKLDVDTYAMVGIGLSYYLDDDLSVNLELMGGETEFDRDSDDDTKDAKAIDANMALININLDYTASWLSMFENRLSPYISGGFSYLFFSEETDDEDDEYSTSSSPGFNAGAGLKFDINSKLYIKGGYRVFRAKIEDSNWQEFDGASITCGWVF